MTAGQGGAGQCGTGEEGETGQGLTFEQFIMLEAMHPDYTEVDPGVDYQSVGVEAGASAARFEGAVRARGAGQCQVRTLVRKNGEPRMFVEMDLPAADAVAIDVLDAVRREDRRALKRKRKHQG